MNKKHGETKEAGRRREECVPIPESEGLGAIRDEGENDGIEQGRLGSEDSEGGHPARSAVFLTGEGDIGKVLERLELLEQGFKFYVGSHRQRLEARLDENKKFVDSFDEGMRQIKAELYNIAAQSLEKPEEPE
ncbi:MAG: hypothetical protein RMY64_19415 [Nostoc sp. DedQUE08]|uniref:hypothetical protein n=1 Tax=unclassified Nostoc TaxID=2593658 RepID=UPI002AD369B9|nr:MULTISPECIES: hypothetical protein [unclassified Nostoc]MDZ8067761.1 hypothetical protein [Nostoc sp. DedQUE08]MDZ8095932.1 hypothetical protein [Nostoc sp. DedQUE05]